MSEMNKKLPDAELKIPVETYSRVSGYYRPVQQWNPGKQEEFRQRKELKIPEELPKTWRNDI